MCRSSLRLLDVHPACDMRVAFHPKMLEFLGRTLAIDRSLKIDEDLKDLLVAVLVVDLNLKALGL